MHIIALCGHKTLVPSQMCLAKATHACAAPLCVKIALQGSSARSLICAKVSHIPSPFQWFQPPTESVLRSLVDYADSDSSSTSVYCGAGGSSYANSAFLVSSAYIDSANSGPGTVTITLI